MFNKIKKSLFNFIVKNFQDEINEFLKLSTKVDIKELAMRMDYEELATNFDIKDIAMHIDYEELTTKVSENIYEEMTIDYDKIVDKLDISDIAEYFDSDDIALNIDMDDLASHIDMDEFLEKFVEKIDYKEIVVEMIKTIKSN